jgi:cell shape-determining protein MreD
MRWAVFAALAFIALAAELSLRPVLMFHTIGGISPSFLACLAVFIAMFAPRLTALWSCWLLGLLLDLSTPFAASAGSVAGVPGAPGGGAATYYLIGPYALGYTFAAYMVLQMRPMVFRQRALSIGVMTGLSLLAVALISVAIFVVRSWYAADAGIYSTGVSAGSELLRRLGIALYSALVAVPLGWLLLATLPYWGFPTTAHRRAGRR